MFLVNNIIIRNIIVKYNNHQQFQSFKSLTHHLNNNKETLEKESPHNNN